MPDTTARDALERTIHRRLMLCDHDDLKALDRVLVVLEKVRHGVGLGAVVASTDEACAGCGAPLLFSARSSGTGRCGPCRRELTEWAQSCTYSETGGEG